MSDKLNRLPPDTDYFQLFDLPGAVFVPKALDAAFHALSRRFHPDFFSNSDDADKAASLENTALVNNAYRTLRDPFSRAAYLIERHAGGKMEDGKPPQALFMEVLEINEQLDELREAKADGDEVKRVQLAEALTGTRDALELEHSGLTKKLLALFGRWDAGEDKETLTAQMRETLGTRKYLGRVLNNLRAEIG